ncbi:MAG: hypothetical protein JST79_20625 [Acidobacteria bacterium]|nr:hypothetical protein [Acidobacteriota bacterium]
MTVSQPSRFRTFKERGEWVELRFMTAALEHGYAVSTPWGDSGSYDVGVQHGTDILRIQVKSTTVRTGTGYFCQFKPNYHKKEDYTLQQVDLFAAYIVPQDTWYLLPAALLLGPPRKTGLMLYPMEPLKKDRYKYEEYKEAWRLLSKSRRALAAKYCGAGAPARRF